MHDRRIPLLSFSTKKTFSCKLHLPLRASTISMSCTGLPAGKKSRDQTNLTRGRIAPPSRPNPRRWILVGLSASENYTQNCQFLSILEPRTTPKIVPYGWGICVPSNTWFLGPTRVFVPNGVSIGSAVLHSISILYNGPRLPKKLLLPLGDRGPI